MARGMLIAAVLGLGPGACTLDASGAGLLPASGAAPSQSAEGTRGSTTGPSGTLDPYASGTSSGGRGSTSSGTGRDPTSTTSGTDTAEPRAVLECDDDQLAACYDFRGVGRGTLVDRSGNGNDAIVSIAALVEGPFGDAATFDEDSRIPVADDASLDIAGALTLEAWVIIDALPDEGERFGILDNEGQYSLMVYGDDRYRCSMGGANVRAGPVRRRQWSHVACVHDASAAEVRLYVDGEQLAAGGSEGQQNTGNAAPMSLGDTSPAFEEPLQGALGGTRVWSTARSAEQLCEAAGPWCMD